MRTLKSDHRSSIRTQVLGIAVIPALVITLFLVFVIYRGNVLQGDQALARQGQMLAAQLASTLEYALSAGAADQIPTTIEATVRPAVEVLRTEVRRVTVLDEQGLLLHSMPAIRASDMTEPGFFLGQTLAMDDIRTFTAPIYLDPVTLALQPSPARRYLGEVSVEISTAPIRAGHIKQFLVEAGLVLLIFGGVALLAHVTGGRLSRAIQEAAQAIQRIKGGDLGVRLQRTESSEIGTLQEGVNLAVEAIVRGKERLERALAEVRAEHELALSRLRVQTEAAEKANQAKSMFLAKVSHEMRTPLYSIEGLTEQLLNTPRNDEDTHSLRNIREASKTLYHTISDILDFTQLEGGRYRPVPRPFELWDEIETSTETVGLLAREQGLYLDVILGRDVPQRIVGDQRGFRTVVANLVSNAVKFTRQGGICIRVELESRHPDRTATITLEVQDSGRGIARDKLVTIFEPFEQVDGGLDRRYGGSGLGLSIVRNYCDAMAGDITVESSPGEGTTFGVRLPFDVCDSAPEPGPDAEFSELRALVVDERPSFCESAHGRLANLGLEVVQRCSPVEALFALPPAARRFDLIVVRDLSRAGAAAQTIQRLQAWARQVMSLETRSDNEQFQTLRDQGAAAVLWAGATRGSIAAALRMMRVEEPAKAIRLDGADRNEPPVDRGELEGRQILVVEDFEINRAIISRQLRDHGLRVIEAGDGDEAIALAVEPGLDLILMDIQMPGRDGIAAIKEIRQIPACAHIPILGFTASADKPTNRRVMEAGADAVLTKPISAEELIGAIQKRLILL